MRDMKKGKKLLIAGCIIVMVLFGMGKLLGAILFPAYEPPEPTGGYTVATKLFTWEDVSRIETYNDSGENRKLTVKFWYPEEEGSYPLVVFSHGAFGIIDSNYSTCQELASHGYVVAGIAHTYHALYVKDVDDRVTIADMDFMQKSMQSGGEYSPEAEEKIYEFSKEFMAVRTADENFVLDTILLKAGEKEEAPFSMVDEEKIGLMGHSMGGASSVQLGRERNDIDAVIDLEGTMVGEYTGFENGIEVYNDQPYPVPVLDVNSKAVHDEAMALLNQQPGVEYVNFYLGRNAADYREVIFRDAGHLNFTDLPMVSPILAKLLGVGEADAEECIGNVNEMTRIYFDHYLKGKGSLDNLKSEY